MARMYAHKRGKSGSTKVHGQDLPEWANTDKKEIEGLISSLHDDGHTAAIIGTILRDQHAVPDVRKVIGQRITSFLTSQDKVATYPEDMMNLMRKAVSIIDHISSNRKDIHNTRALELTESKIRRLAKYYQSKGRLAADWKYKRDQIRLMVE
jgi:small subunit ribosomal protein S15